MIPTRRLHGVLEIVLEVVGALALRARSRGAVASATTAATSASSTAGLAAGRPSAKSEAAIPARRPKTRRSDSELPPSRLAPCMPPGHSPAAKSPGTVVASVSASTRIPPMV